MASAGVAICSAPSRKKEDMWTIADGADGVELSLRHRAPSRSDYDLLAPVLRTYGLSADEPVTRPRPERADRLQAIEIVSSMSDCSTAVTSCTTSGSSVRICPVPSS